MDNKIVLLIVVLVAIAGIGGYLVGLYQGSGNFSLNITNNTTGTANDTGTAKTTNVTPVKNNTNKSNNTPVKNNTTFF
ncbi:hypothetical protein [Methanobacterium spitsbergense]|uniref:Uncharacterized protein n=1 Tax=Methanobacterium spitsbergense TaxID=2874285 RepID=A0A8T5UYX9_9EURY|nr:hypothetical protein [Methanobacterium spitsbergense]MBZ2166013.1 hypothetical protein [Methanobacterium spitsbergense]